jgi:hypothetical protein
VWITACEVGEERKERFIIGVHVGGESRTVEPLPARHVINEENAVKREVR